MACYTSDILEAVLNRNGITMYYKIHVRKLSNLTYHTVVFNSLKAVKIGYFLNYSMNVVYSTDYY